MKEGRKEERGGTEGNEGRAKRRKEGWTERRKARKEGRKDRRKK